MSAKLQEQVTNSLLDQLREAGYLREKQQERDLLSYIEIVQSTENTDENRKKAVGLLTAFIDTAGKTGKISREICLRYLLPAIYDMNKEKPLRQFFCFMQPRYGLNQTFSYLYRVLENNYPWGLKLYEMHRGDCPTEEYYTNAAWFFKDMATSPVTFVHETSNLMGHLHLREGTQVIQLWHGCGVFKKIGLSTAGKKGYRSLKFHQEYPEYNQYSLVTIASPELSWVFEEFMGIPKEKGIIQPLGVSRTDEFFQESYRKESFRKLYEAIPAARGKKVILYAPTYRDLGAKRRSPDALNIPYLARRLGDDYILIVKHHQTVRVVPEIPEPYRDTFAYDMTRGRGMDINELMTVADICITDYSSVAFEFSLFCRPLLFFVFDMDEYIDNRGLYYDFDEITPGPLCRTNEELADAILKIREEGFDDTKIREFRDRFMCSCDGHSTKRLIRYLIGKLLPVPEEFSPSANAKKEGQKFLGFWAYRMEDQEASFLLSDGTFERDPDEKDSKNRRLLNTKESLKDSLLLDPPVYFSPVWDKPGIYVRVKQKARSARNFFKKARSKL